MRIINKFVLAKEVRLDWLRRFRTSRFREESIREAQRKIIALGEDFHPNEIETQGLQNYLPLRTIDCEECEAKDLEEVVEIACTLVPDYDSPERPVWVCANCLLQALQLINP